MDVIEIQELLVNEFTSDEQRLFVHNFQCYLRCDADKDFVIDFDKVYRWVGFGQKVHAKRVLSKHFQEGAHFLVSRSGEQDRDGKTSAHGGHNKETIMLTPNAFKEFCMRADTEKAREVRSYYIKMERLVFKGMELALQKANERYMSAQEKIRALEHDLKKYQGRKKQRYELGDTVYIVKERGISNLYKVGCSENMNSREMSYFCHSNQCVIVYTRRSKNCKFLEKAVHNRFERHRYQGRVEWFQIPFEELRQGLEDIQVLLEGELSPHFTFDQAALEDVSPSSLQMNAPHVESVVEIPELAAPADGIQARGVIMQQDTSEDEEEVVVENISPPPPNFEKFFEECYDKVEGEKASWVEMGARYRLWSRSTNNHREGLSTFLQEHGFKETFLFDPKTKTNSIAYLGLRMKPLPRFTLTQNSSEVEQFLFACCKPTVTGRITIKQLREAFFEWKKREDPDYAFVTRADTRAIKAYCNQRFLASTVHDGSRIRFGYYGVCMKGCEDVGRKTKPRNRKEVEQVHPSSGEVLRTYDSITHAAQEVGVTIAAISVAISAQKRCKGFVFRRKE